MELLSLSVSRQMEKAPKQTTTLHCPQQKLLFFNLFLTVRFTTLALFLQKYGVTQKKKKKKYSCKSKDKIDLHPTYLVLINSGSRTANQPFQTFSVKDPAWKKSFLTPAPYTDSGICKGGPGSGSSGVSQPGTQDSSNRESCPNKLRFVHNSRGLGGFCTDF